MSKLSLILPAAGSGVRMGTELPKPFIEINGRAILSHTIDKFINIHGLKQVIVVASAQNVSRVESLISNYSHTDLQFIVVEGGNERQYSIYNALGHIDEDADLVIIHDSVRPLIKVDHIIKCIESAGEYGAAILGVPVRDTIKKVDGEQMVRSTPDRSKLWQIQTPQVFKREILVDAYKKSINEGFSGTDDSSLIEYFGKDVRVVEGDMSNFKITYPFDLRIAEQVLKDES